MFTDTLTRIIRAALAALQYTGTRPAVVVADKGTRLDVQLTDGTTITANKRIGLAPGDTSRVSAGVSCLVGFVGRVATVVAYDHDTESKYHMAPDGFPLARHGDLVEVPVSIADTIVGVVIPPDPVVQAAINGGAGTLPVGTAATIIGVVAAVDPVGNVVGSTAVLRA